MEHAPIRRSGRIATMVMAVGLGTATPGAAQDQVFEVETAGADKLLQVQDDAGFVVRGTLTEGTIPATGAGVRLMWYPGRGAFRAGMAQEAEWDDDNIGPFSAAWGLGTLALGRHSVAMGFFTRATGDNAVATGSHTSASGLSATAIGVLSKASGSYSKAGGRETTASGEASLAFGRSTVAEGDYSVALGSFVSARGDGSFVFGDQSTQYPMKALANQFQVRAFGGVLMNTGVDIGCYLGANEGAWTCTSSRLAKEGFEAVDGEEVLGKLAAMPIQRWRYLGSDAEHVGPVAEDFHAAFGLGEGTTGIATVDADGIALRAIQALERRTAELQKENAELRLRLQALESR